MRVKTKSVCLAIVLTLVGSLALTSEAFGQASGGIDAMVKSLEPRIPMQAGTAYPASPSLQAYAQGRVFVAYPGSPGIQTDVFTENFDALRRDFGVRQEQILYRDVRGWQARPGAGRSEVASAVPPGYYLVRDRGGQSCGLAPGSSAYRAATEAAFLRSVYEEFRKPLVVLCHSAFCPDTLQAVLAANFANGTPIVDAFFFIQGNNPPRAIGQTTGAINAGLSRAALGQPGCALQNPIPQNLASSPYANRAYFIADWGSGRNNYAPAGYGVYLGPLNSPHIEAVVASQRAHQPARFRWALMHAMVAIAAGGGAAR